MKKDIKGRILVIDDESANIIILKRILGNDYTVYASTDGADAIEAAEDLLPDIILLDVVMPDMDGHAVIAELKNSKKTKDIPVIFLTAMTSPEDEVKGLSLGAVDYIFKPFSASLILKRVELHLQLKRYSIGLEEMVAEKTRALYKMQDAILETVAELIEFRDIITGGHIERTQDYLRLLVDLLIKNGIYAEQLLSWDIDLFVMSSQLHDVGKISIKDNILMKPGELTDEEFEVMKTHVDFGLEIINKIEVKTEENSFLEHAKLSASSHHEKWDGTGYPLGIKEEEIPFQGRLMAIIDVYDALTNIRPYKDAFTHKEALEVIKAGTGTHFDPLLCEIFLRYEKDFEKIRRFQIKDSSLPTI